MSQTTFDMDSPGTYVAKAGSGLVIQGFLESSDKTTMVMDVASSTPPPPPPPPTGKQKVGFWIQSQGAMKYNPVLFADAYFGKPPYPAALALMCFGPVTGQTTEEIAWLEAMSVEAGKYPGAEILLCIAVDFLVPASVADFEDYVSTLGKHPSVVSFGLEGEYTKGWTTANVTPLYDSVKQAGKRFISYYINPGVGEALRHTNFPGGDRGGSDQVGTLKLGQSAPYVGMDAGYYATFSFPGKLTCPIGADAVGPSTWQWNQCAVDTVISEAVAIKEPFREFVFIIAGYPLPRFSMFLGVSGIKTSQLWDHPTLRSWIWNSADYKPNFALSTG
ncbi:MAG: hypothetical protein ACRECH_15520 [Nitrososphaerales archaeon]